jgi:type IV secretory pathway TraG/TraD family ATPase VirD4
MLPGVGDLATLEAISRLAGQTEVVVRSVSSSGWWSRNPSSHTTYSSRRQARLPVDRVHSLPAGAALLVTSARPPQLVGLTRWWEYPPFCEASNAASVAPSVPHELAPPPAGTGPSLSPLLSPHRLAQPPPPVPPTPPASPAKPRPTAPTAPARSADDIVWRRVPGQRRLHPPPPRL